MRPSGSRIATMETQKFQTAEFSTRTVGDETWYDLNILGDAPYLWGKPGRYRSLQDAIDTFSPPLKQGLQAAIFDAIEIKGTAAFPLKDAYKSV